MRCSSRPPRLKDGEAMGISCCYHGHECTSSKTVCCHCKSGCVSVVVPWSSKPHRPLARTMKKARTSSRMGAKSTAIPNQQKCLLEVVLDVSTALKASSRVGKPMLVYVATRRKSNVTWTLLASHALVAQEMASHVRNVHASHIRSCNPTNTHDMYTMLTRCQTTQRS